MEPDFVLLTQLVADEAGPLVYQLNTLAQPAVAAAFATVVVPGGQTWLLEAIHYRLVTDANAANRFLMLTVDDGEHVIARIPQPVTQAASLTVDYSYTAGGDRNVPAINGVVTAPMPRLLLFPGYRITFAATAFQAGDQLSLGAILTTRIDRAPISPFKAYDVQ